VLRGLRRGRNVSTGGLIALGLGGGALVFLLVRRQQQLAAPTAQKGPPAQQPDSCSSAGSVYGIPLCTGAAKPFLEHLPIVSGVVDLFTDDDKVSIEGCPYLTGKDFRGRKMAGAPGEVEKCIEWAKSPEVRLQRARAANAAAAVLEPTKPLAQTGFLAGRSTIGFA
jgi:hypothetical protein